MLTGVQSFLKDLVFPPMCSGCGERGVWVCDLCSVGLPAFANIPGCCQRCGLPVLGGQCSCRTLHPKIVSVQSVYPYAGWVAAAVHGVKYDGEKDRALFLGSVLSASSAASALQRADLIVPVPMYYKRELERGYNQASLMALRACQELGVAHPVPLIVQHEARPSQVGLNARQRRMNVRGSFSLNDEVVARGKGPRIVLVDDVRTTGSTLSACVEVLRGVRPSRIDVVTLAAELSEEVAEHIGLKRT